MTDDPLKRLPKLFRGGNRHIALKVVHIIECLREYWPLTVRQVFYQAVSKLLFSNTLSNYQRTSKILTTLRRNDIVPWSAIEDRTRRTVDKRGVPDVAYFINEQVETFLDWRYYHRCYVQDQDVYLEVATEKDALSKIMEDAVWMYCTRLNIVRGQGSATIVEKMAGRFDQAIMNGQEPKLIYFGDLDPSGIAIPRALTRNMEEHHGVSVELVRAALNPDQISKYDLAISPDAAKEKDPNYDTWIREYGDTPPTELDALHPKALTTLVEQAIEDELDMSGVSEEMEREKAERALLKRMKVDVGDFLHNEYPEEMAEAYGYK